MGLHVQTMQSLLNFYENDFKMTTMIFIETTLNLYIKITLNLYIKNANMGSNYSGFLVPQMVTIIFLFSTASFLNSTKKGYQEDIQ